MNTKAYSMNSADTTPKKAYYDALSKQILAKAKHPLARLVRIIVGYGLAAMVSTNVSMTFSATAWTSAWTYVWWAIGYFILPLVILAAILFALLAAFIAVFFVGLVAIHITASIGRFNRWRKRRKRDKAVRKML